MCRFDDYSLEWGFSWGSRAKVCTHLSMLLGPPLWCVLRQKVESGAGQQVAPCLVLPQQGHLRGRGVRRDSELVRDFWLNQWGRNIFQQVILYLLTQCDIKKSRQLLTQGHVTNLCNAYRVLRSTTNEVELSKPPHLDWPVRRRTAAHRLVEGVAASLTGGGAHPLHSQRE